MLRIPGIFVSGIFVIALIAISVTSSCSSSTKGGDILGLDQITNTPTEKEAKELVDKKLSLIQQQDVRGWTLEKSISDELLHKAVETWNENFILGEYSIGEVEKIDNETLVVSFVADIEFSRSPVQEAFVDYMVQQVIESLAKQNVTDEEMSYMLAVYTTMIEQQMKDTFDKVADRINNPTQSMLIYRDVERDSWEVMYLLDLTPSE